MPRSLIPQSLREPFPTRFRIAIIADLDKRSKRKDESNKDQWHSKYMTGTLYRDSDKYRIEWDAPIDVTTSHNEAGRGCELSELVKYNGALYTFDDRTGIMFEISDFADSSARGDHAPALAPRMIFSEGDGNTDKGFKIEWATVKDGVMYVGSFGKEYTSNSGAILHANNLWVVQVTKDGRYSHVDWSPYYGKMRKELGYEHPG